MNKIMTKKKMTILELEQHKLSNTPNNDHSLPLS